MADLNTTEKRPSRLFRIVLVASLALNLIILGVVAGAGFSGRLDKGLRSFNFATGPFVAALAPEDRQGLRDRMRTQDAASRLPRAQIAAQLAVVVTALRSEPFDPSALEDFLGDVRQRGTVLQQEAQAALIAQIADMTASERQAFAGRLEQELKRPRSPRPRQ